MQTECFEPNPMQLGKATSAYLLSATFGIESSFRLRSSAAPLAFGMGDAALET